MSRKRPTPLLAILGLLAALAAGWWTTQGGGSAPSAPAPQAAPQAAPQPGPQPAPVPSLQAQDPAAWPPGTRAVPYPKGGAIFREVNRTLDLIEAGGPFPFTRDGVEFQNRERLLPPSDYREYTVVTPGENDRGARRLVVDQENGVAWLTLDHYDSFEAVARVRLP